MSRGGSSRLLSGGREHLDSDERPGPDRAAQGATRALPAGPLLGQTPSSVRVLASKGSSDPGQWSAGRQESRQACPESGQARRRLLEPRPLSKGGGGRRLRALTGVAPPGTRAVDGRALRRPLLHAGPEPAMPTSRTRCSAAPRRSRFTDQHHRISI